MFAKPESQVGPPGGAMMPLGSVHFSSLINWGVRGDRRDDSAEILFQSFLQEALVC